MLQHSHPLLQNQVLPELALSPVKSHDSVEFENNLSPDISPFLKFTTSQAETCIGEDETNSCSPEQCHHEDSTSISDFVLSSEEECEN